MHKRLGEALVSLILKEPFYAHVISQMQQVEDSSIPTMGVSLTYPIRLFYSPHYLESLSLQHLRGVLRHEVLHLVMEHPLRAADKHLQLFNAAADLAANELLNYDELPDGVLTVNGMSKVLGINLPRRASAETYYALLEQNSAVMNIVFGSNGGQAGGNNEHNNSGYGGLDREFRPLDEHIFGGLSPVEMELAREAIREIVASAQKTCGTIPGELQSFITALQERQVNWRRVLMRFLLGRGRMVAQPTYTRESRRFEGYPGKRKRIGLEALAAIDTSGSITDDDLSQILGELLQIKKISGTKIHVVWGDTRLAGGPLPIEKVTGQIKMCGRGGTDLRWPFELATKMRLPLVVYFTDGYGPVPSRVLQKTLWVITKNGKEPASYGESIVFR